MGDITDKQFFCVFVITEREKKNNKNKQLPWKSEFKSCRRWWSAHELHQPMAIKQAQTWTMRQFISHKVFKWTHWTFTWKACSSCCPKNSLKCLCFRFSKNLGSKFPHQTRMSDKIRVSYLDAGMSLYFYIYCPILNVSFIILNLKILKDPELIYYNSKVWIVSVCSIRGCKEKYIFLPYQHLLSCGLNHLLYLGKIGGWSDCVHVQVLLCISVCKHIDKYR